MQRPGHTATIDQTIPKRSIPTAAPMTLERANEESPEEKLPGIQDLLTARGIFVQSAELRAEQVLTCHRTGVVRCRCRRLGLLAVTGSARQLEPANHDRQGHRRNPDPLRLHQTPPR